MYDNGCNTQHFLGRDRVLQTTQIFIDSFHSDPQTLLADCTTQVRTFDLEGALAGSWGTARLYVQFPVRCVLELATMGRSLSMLTA
jgi:hypothetical protein